RLASSAWGVPSFAGNVLRAFSASGASFAGSCGTVFSEQHNCNLGWVKFAKVGYRHDLVQPDQPLPSGDDYVIDNIYYNTKPIPKPSTFPLLGSETDSISDCEQGGWETFQFPRAFKNQGDCIQFVETGK